MVSATTSDPLALDLWPPSSGTGVARPLPGDRDAAGVTGSGGLPKLEVEEYVRGLEEERSKMEGFRRELPLCMLILTHAIEGLKGELAQQRGGADAMAVKKKLEDEGEVKERKNCPEKVNWMSSARLWSPNRGSNTSTVKAAIGDDTGKDAGELGTDELPSHQSPRNARRCWSPELHRRFVNAVEQLGGSEAATPKQIRGLLNVDGLTNDQVKSHLQKYRLNTQRLPASSSAVKPAFLWRGLRVTKEKCPAGKQSTSQSGCPPGTPQARQPH